MEHLDVPRAEMGAGADRLDRDDLTDGERAGIHDLLAGRHGRRAVVVDLDAVHADAAEAGDDADDAGATDPALADDAGPADAAVAAGGVAGATDATFVGR